MRAEENPPRACPLLPSLGSADGGSGGGGSLGRGRVSVFVAEFDSAREFGALFDKIRPSSALGDDQDLVIGSLRDRMSSEMLPRFGSSADFFGLFTRIASISRDFRLPFVMSRDMSHRSRLFGWLPHPNFPIWTSSGYARAFVLVSARQTLPTSSASTAGQFGADSTSSNEPRLNAPGT
jgi:hypothetical protein